MLHILIYMNRKRSQIFLLAFLFWGAGLCFVDFLNTVSTRYFHLLTRYASYLVLKDDNELEREEPQPYYFNLCSEGNSFFIKQKKFAMINTQALEKSPVTADLDFLPSKASSPRLKLR